MFDSTDPDPNGVARSGVERVVHDVLRARHGGEALVQRPISPRIDIPHWVPVDYAAGIVAARTVAGYATRMVCEYARAARGEGLTWRELAEPLGIEPDEDGYTDLAAAAFEMVAPEPPRRFDTRTTSWRCAGPEGCGELITDRGPYNGHPVDNETGHAETCVRHRVEIAEYEARMDA